MGLSLKKIEQRALTPMSAVFASEASVLQQFSFWPEARAETVRSSAFRRSEARKTA
jgi:hypothetical protein